MSVRRGYRAYRGLVMLLTQTNFVIAPEVVRPLNLLTERLGAGLGALRGILSDVQPAIRWRSSLATGDWTLVSISAICLA